MSEVAQKLAAIRQRLTASGAGALRLKGVDWFAWATGGKDSSVIFSAECGVAEILVTSTLAYVLTNFIEKDRFAVEQLPPEFELRAFPWEEPSQLEAFVQASVSGEVLSDHPAANEQLLGKEWLVLRLKLTNEEILRYRELGTDAARAATEALTQATPNTTEVELAGLAAKALWAKGIHPMLTLVGGESRVERYRHPVAGFDSLGSKVMLVICGRRGGLYANLTRQVFFRPPTAEEMTMEKVLAAVEAEAFRGLVANLPLPQIYEALKLKYEEAGWPEEIHRHHQGGPTGYLSREAIAGPALPAFPLPGDTMAFAWNPSLPGAKIEDTVLLYAGKIEVLTVDPLWPSFLYEDLARPGIWVREDF